MEILQGKQDSTSRPLAGASPQAAHQRGQDSLELPPAVPQPASSSKTRPFYPSLTFGLSPTAGYKVEHLCAGFTDLGIQDPLFELACICLEQYSCSPSCRG